MNFLYDDIVHALKYNRLFRHRSFSATQVYQIQWKKLNVTVITPFKITQGHRVWYQSKSHMRLSISDNTNLAPILHRFRDIAFDRSKIAILACLTLPTEGFSCDDLRKILPGCQQMERTKWRTNIAENFNRLSRAHERYRQTDDRQTDGRYDYSSPNTIRFWLLTLVLLIPYVYAMTLTSSPLTFNVCSDRLWRNRTLYPISTKSNNGAELITAIERLKIKGQTLFWISW